ncbi:MAG TPA: ATP-binding protein [Steroidobacter sp.]|uniref:ATP-binding protein n=1 Tax=Steroidobacter sp. TaxID=1978227 RepID=UPI002ED80468
MTASLHGRLLLTILIVISLVWVAWFGCQVLQTRQQQETAWDEISRDTAEKIITSMPRDLELTSQPPGFRMPEPAEPRLREHRMAFQVWLKDGARLLLGSPAIDRKPLKPDFRDGRAMVLIGEEEWRVFALSDAENIIQVQIGKPQSELDAAARYQMQLALLAAIVTFVLLTLAIWLVICLSLRSVDRLQAIIQARHSLDLEPLPNTKVPSEIQPLVDSFNRLLVQLSAALEGERRFIADAAHELRTPLAALTAHAELALNARDGRSEREALLNLMAVVKRSGRLSEQLLDLARIDSRPEASGSHSIELHELVLLVARDFEVMASKKQQTLSLQIEPCTMQGYIDELGILVRNLIDNAVRYAGEGGRIEIACKNATAAGGAQEVRLRVADDGPGVPAEERERIFDRFYRVPGSSERGSGIGLSLVSRIAQLHGASIEVSEGIAGRGFAVTLSFPKA